MKKRVGDERLPELWRRWKRERDTQARDDLFERHLYLVGQTVHRLWPKLQFFIDREDAEMEAKLALLQAMESYNPACGTTLETWALPRIRGTLLRLGENAARRKRLAEMLSLDEDLAHFEAFVEPAKGPEAQLFTRYEHEALEEALDLLEEVDRLVLEAIFHGDLSLGETGEALGLKADKVQRVRNRALKRLKRWMEGR